MSESIDKKTARVDNLPDLIIFDKDGTLIDFHSTWIPWVTALAASLENDCKLNVSSKIFDVIGYCDKTNTLRDSSLLAYASMDQIKKEIKIVLLEGGVDDNDVDGLIHRCWYECHVNNTNRPVPTTDLSRLFTWLHDIGMKTAVCTSDSRTSTESALRKLKIYHLLDVVVCCDDEKMEAKPSPVGVLSICNRLKIKPSHTMLIGDTTVDMMMAKSANVGFIAGVLTGIGTRNELSKYADVVLDNVDNITTLFSGLTEISL